MRQLTSCYEVVVGFRVVIRFNASWGPGTFYSQKKKGGKSWNEDSNCFTLRLRGSCLTIAINGLGEMPPESGRDVF